MRVLHILLAYFLTLCYAIYDDFRLPRSIEPRHYDLRILTHLEDPANLFFTGDVEIHMVVIVQTDNITLHVGKELNIAPNDTWVRSITDKCTELVKIISVQRNPEKDFYTLNLETSLKPVHRYLLHLHFWSRLGRGTSGYYLSTYQVNDRNTTETRYIAVTQFEPTDARCGFPCFDEPDMKATFNITLGHMCHYNAHSNMPLMDVVPICERENWVWSIFKQSEVMSTYLVAYTINDFEGFLSNSRRFEPSVKFVTWTRAALIEQCQYAAEIAPKIILYFEMMFNIRFPLTKIDQIAVPDFGAGAMENWGLIIYRENSLLYSEEDSSQLDKQRVTNTIAHELAHQWFGNLVTMKWWDDIWLNEGFATYAVTLAIESLCCDWNAYEEQSIEYMHSVLTADGYCSTRQIHQAVSRPNQIAQLFDLITYRKGAVIIRMLHIFIGDTAFRRGIHEYLKNHAYSNAKQQDLWKSLTKAARDIESIPQDLDVGTIMDTWTLQKGIPLIKVTRQYALKIATITQHRFMLHNEGTNFPMTFPDYPLDNGSCWFVPISYTTESQSDFMTIEPRAWLRCKELNADTIDIENLPDDDEWLLLNIQQGTPYRINYDPTNWELLIEGLRCTVFRRIHVMNRAQLVDDVMALAWSGQVPYSTALKLLDYLKNEHEFIPWRAVLDQMGVIERVIRETCEFEDFQHYMHHLLHPIYTHLEGMEEDTEFSHHVAHKTLITRWACRLRQEDCVKKALHYFNRWCICEDPDEFNPVPRNLRSVVYCTAMQHGDEEDWEFMWQRYHKATAASEKHTILHALTCIHNATLIERFLKLTFCDNSPIRKQNAAQIFIDIVHNYAGFRIAKEFLLNYFEQLRQYFDPERRNLAELVVQVANHLSSVQDYREMKIFLNSHKEVLKTSRRCLRRAMEQMHMNLRWRQMKLTEFTNNMSLRYCD